MNNDDQILTAVRTWLNAVTGLDKVQIIPADDKGTRPALPYLSMRVMASDIHDGFDEPRPSINGTSGDIDERPIGRRRGTLEINGYGRGAKELIEVAGLSLAETRTQQLLSSEKIYIRPNGGINDISSLVDNEIEKRYARDFDLHYAIERESPVEDSAKALDVFDVELELDTFTFTFEG